MSAPPTADQRGSLIDFSVDAVVLADADGIIQWANAATPAVFGHDAVGLAGLRLVDLIESGDRDGWQQLWRALFDHPDLPGRGTFRVRHKDGGVRWIEAAARNLLQEPRVGSVVIYFRDVTDRKATEEALRASEDRYGHLFHSAADVIFEADAEGCFRFVNPHTLRVFRVRRR